MALEQGGQALRYVAESPATRGYSRHVIAPSGHGTGYEMPPRAAAEQVALVAGVSWHVSRRISFRALLLWSLHMIAGRMLKGNAERISQGNSKGIERIPGALRGVGNT